MKHTSISSVTEKSRQNDPSPLCRKAGISNKVIAQKAYRNYTQELISLSSFCAKAKALYWNSKPCNIHTSSPPRFVRASTRCFDDCCSYKWPSFDQDTGDQTLLQRLRSEITNTISHGLPFKRSRGTRRSAFRPLVFFGYFLWRQKVTRKSCEYSG